MHRTLVPACWPSPGRVLCAALMLGLAFAPAAQAQYKWKDARGQLHASDMPPPADIPERQVLQRPAGQRAAPGSPVPLAQRPAGDSRAATTGPGRASEALAAPASPEDAELARRRQKAEAERQAQASAEAQRQASLRAQNCERARQQLAQLQSGQRLQRISATGERVPVDDATREADTALARQVVASDCR